MKEHDSLSEAMIKDAEIETIDDLLLDELLEEIELIQDATIRSWVRLVLTHVEAFWVSAATLAEESHPPDERVEGGMVLHTKRVARTCFLLANTFDCSSLDLDILLAAALLHDVTKAIYRDDEKKEIFHDQMHAYTVDALVSWIMVQEQVKPVGKGIFINEETMHKILRIIRTSHGIWSQIPETFPITTMERTFHIADIVAANLHGIIDGAEPVEQRWILPET